MRLTPRERQVADLLIRGASNAYIAEALGITERTAKMHLTNIFRRNRLSSRLQLAVEWQRLKRSRSRLIRQRILR